MTDGGLGESVVCSQELFEVDYAPVELFYKGPQPLTDTV